MIDEEKLKRVRIFSMVNGQEFIALIQKSTLTSVTVEGACRLITIFQIGDNKAGSLRGIYKFSQFSDQKTLRLSRSHIVSEIEPSENTLKLWLEYLYPPVEDDEDIKEESDEDGQSSHLSLA